MSTQVIDIVNSALNRVGLEAITEEEFDSGTESHCCLLREAFKEIWEDICMAKSDDLKKVFTLDLVAGQAEYKLNFPLYLLSNLSLSLEYYGKLVYITEESMRKEFPSLENLPLGKPNAWFIATTENTNNSQIMFYPCPDNNYKVIGMRQQEEFEILSSSVTPCNKLGDRCIKKYLEWILQLEGGFSNAIYFERRFENSWNEYIACTDKKNIQNNFIWPYQN